MPSEWMDLNIHRFPRSLVHRARARAALLGVTLRQWIMDLMEGALSDRDTPCVTLPPKADDGHPSLIEPRPPGGHDE